MKTIKDIINEESGASYLSSKIDVKELIVKLKEAFCEEMNAWYQYIIIAPFLVGPERTNVEADYMENAKDELEDHGYWLLHRINELGGDCSDIHNPSQWNNVAPHKYITPAMDGNVETSVKQMIKAEQGAIETYEALEEFTRDKDVVTNKKMKDILADEQEHLQEMEEFLADIQSK